MTEKLYYQDPYLFSFRATVRSCTESAKGFEVILDRSAFFPEEGGQYADSGLLGGINVIDVQEKDGEIVHLLESPIPVGCEAIGQIEERQRLRKMQNHTGEHIVSGLFHSLYGLNNVGFHLGNEDVTIDLSGELTRADLDRVEALANEAIWKNLPVLATFPSPDALSALEYRSKLDLTENVRIVTIPGYDVCACCAPHVRYTGEVGQIKLLDFARYKGGVRIHMLCGMDALDDYRLKYTSVAAISAKLTAPQAEVAEAVDRLSAELQEKKQQILALQSALADCLLDATPDAPETLIFFENRLDMPIRRKLINAAAEKCTRLAALFCGNDADGYTYLIGSATINLKEWSRTLHDTLGGRGGGSPTMIQGSLPVSRDKIEEFLK